MPITGAGLKPIASPSRSAKVVEALREAIYSGRLKPGESIREMPLARDLQVSQTTIREALLQLEHAGLIVRQPNRGTRVTELSPKEIGERVGLRLALEQIAAGEAARRANREHLQELEVRLREISAAVSANAYYEAGQADLEFHRSIWRASGNQTLCRVLDDLTVPLFAFVSMAQSRALDDLSTRTLRHEPILAAIRSGAPSIAREAISAHIVGSYGDFLNHEED
jgi:DNA-binding GntR family transcriptional regulator